MSPVAAPSVAETQEELDVLEALEDEFVVAVQFDASDLQVLGAHRCCGCQGSCIIISECGTNHV